MNWTIPELTWLGAIVAGGAVALIGGLIDMRSPLWPLMLRQEKAKHVAGLVAIAAMLTVFLVCFGRMSINL